MELSNFFDRESRVGNSSPANDVHVFDIALFELF